ncbi:MULTISPECIES: DUF2309 domain-containing protein [Mycobacteriaceae]|uniref:Probable inorganic carbon transporter subunit DabA n=1 Tax=Mycolicibacterium neoaurum VKM Ac-1815D TaxID=700508 RepID=V5XJ55_MYCNE|nr:MULTISPECIES: DUF2309 domain-containing protein [Mycobacteriaceae]AHC27948.1 membrane protein [Mycolicibacterium neoaurum VKM Ac-1815D]AMO08364.1 membrane protein [Mycolicibacterium neoaurum]AXK75466.1 DUF2309 domain-containing protein [Mycolicibacterium neoaurum]KJQ50541.1 membrane protein [Mycolicibacterium neoaurum]KUM09472.1 hypothetical protein AVZ31_04470 [Mycolicibacterium neoaurum]
MTPTDTAARRAQLRSDIRIAARALPTHFPLGTFIAVNPLAGLQNMPFEQAIRRASDVYGMRGTLPESVFRALYRQGRITDADLEVVLCRRYPNLGDEPDISLADRNVAAIDILRADLLHGHVAPEPRRRFTTRAEQISGELAADIDAHAATWCAAFLGGGSWSVPDHAHGFYTAWRNSVRHDRTLPRAARRKLRAAPERPDDAVLKALERLRIGDEDRVVYLQAHLTRLPGWAAHIQWGADRAAGIDLLQYLAVRLSVEAALAQDAPRPPMTDAPRSSTPTARERAAHLLAVWHAGTIDEAEQATVARVLATMPVGAREMLWQQAFEGHYQDQLLSALTKDDSNADADADADAVPVHTQMVTCIDTRSEGLRRHLESREGYQTFGFAGFFAVAIRFTGLLGGEPMDLCPVLISPSHQVSEKPVGDARRHVAGATGLAAAESSFHTAKQSYTGSFTLAEAAGFLAGPLAAAKTAAPAASGSIRKRLHEWIAPTPTTVLAVSGMPLSERVLFAQAIFQSIGLTGDFARLLVLCGHHSTTENNPYQASLDCGACGGQGGGPNARTAALILNDPEVRAELRMSGIAIPDDTLVVAAVHDTTTDRVTVLDQHLVPAGHRADIDRLTTHLAHAGAHLAAERCNGLPGAPRRRSATRAARHVVKRSLDWAQVYPEWGLANNSAFIIAPREVTAGVDLQRRVFLHSYEAEVDADGTALENIMTAPLVVAQWINCQYYFSTVAPDTFGAGSKTIHNVVGDAGVLTGHAGDLRLGLPQQSVQFADRLIHEPQRLLAVVQAPLARIDTVIDRNPLLKQLFDNDWVSIAAREQAHRSWHRRTRNGWRDWYDDALPTTAFDKEMIR